MVALPRLLANGDVLFASAEDVRVAYSTYLQRGALAVVTDVHLVPLTPTMVRLTGAGFSSPVIARCEVVSQQSERSLLRILEPEPAAFAHLAELHVAAPEATDEPSPAVAGDAVPEVPCLGRFLRGDVLALHDDDEFARARVSIQESGQLRARVALPGVVYGRRSIAIRVGDVTRQGRLLADLHPAIEGEISLRFGVGGAVDRVLSALSPPIQGSTSVASTRGPTPAAAGSPAASEAHQTLPQPPPSPSSPSPSSPSPSSPSPSSPSPSPPVAVTSQARTVPAAIDFLEVPPSGSAPSESAPSASAPARGAQSVAPPAESTSPELKHILAVEDDATNLRMLTLFLEKSGFLVSGASDGTTALSMITEGSYDLVLLDVMMPGLTGLEVLEEVRKTKSPVELPVIMVSAMSDSVSVVKAITLGANDYVTKPYEFSILLARMTARLAIDVSKSEVARTLSPTPPPPPEEKARLEAALPHLEGDQLAFPSRDDLVATGKDIKVLRAVRATTASPQRGMEPRMLRLTAGDREASFALAAMINPGPEGTAVIQFDDGKAIDRAFAELSSDKAPSGGESQASHRASSIGSAHAPADSAPPRPSPVVAAGSTVTSSLGAERPRTSGGRTSLSLAPRGVLRNPSTAAAIRSMNVMLAVTPEQQAEPTAHLLLRWLLTTKGTLRVDVQCQSRAAVTFYVVDGSEVRSSLALTALGRGLAGGGGTYEVTQERRPVAQSQRAGTLALMQETTRALCGTFSDVQLEDALGDMGTLVPLLNATGRTLLDKLGLPKPYERLAARRFIGRDPVAALLNEEIGARAVLETLYVLEVAGALDWAGRGAAGTAQQTDADDRFRKMANEYEAKIANANHFEVLGLHWSSSLRSIPDAYRDLRKLYGPDGAARATASDVCDRVWQRIEVAYETLREPAARQAYRRRTYQISWSQQVNLMLDRAELSIYRNDLKEANDLLLVCKDIEPSPRIEEMLQKLKGEENKGLS
ncbi:MAG: response regulator [Myxococcota bacterium]